jgi:hypothetical protein
VGGNLSAIKTKVSYGDIQRLRKTVEASVGVLHALNDGRLEVNPAEKLLLFMSAIRAMSRAVLWGTSLNLYSYSDYLKHLGFGYNLDLDQAIETTLYYGCLFLQEIEFNERHISNQGLVEQEEESDREQSSD